MSPISEEQFQEAKARLRRIEAEYGVRILYAGEVGSRARGVASSDADFDVRFLFVYPVAEYLKLAEPPHEIQVRDGLWDIRGLDLKEALRQLKSGEPQTVSWLYTDPAYRNHPLFETEMKKRLEMLAPVSKLWWHLNHRATDVKAQLAKGPQATYKLLLSAAEMALGLKFLNAQEELPPLDFATLVVSVRLDEADRETLQALAKTKRESEEAAETDISQYPVVTRLLEEALALPPLNGNGIPNNVNEEDLNEFFLRWVGYER